MNSAYVSSDLKSKTKAILVYENTDLPRAVGNLLKENDVEVVTITLAGAPSIGFETTSDITATLLDETDYVYIFDSPAIHDFLMRSSLISKLSEFNLKISLISSIKSGADFLGLSVSNLRNIRVGQYYGDILSGSIIIDYLRQALDSKVINVPSDGLSQVNLTHIKDLAKGIILATISPYLKSDRIVLSSGEAISTLSLAYKIRSIIPNKIEIKLEGGIPDVDDVDWKAQQKLYDDIGWLPTHQLQENLEDHIAYILKELNHSKAHTGSDSKDQDFSEASSIQLEQEPTNEITPRNERLTPLALDVSGQDVPLANESRKLSITKLFSGKKKTADPVFVQKRAKKRKPKSRIKLKKAPLIAIIILGIYSFSILLSFSVLAVSTYNLIKDPGSITSPSNILVRQLKLYTYSYLNQNLKVLDKVVPGETKNITDLSSIIEASIALEDMRPNLDLALTSTSNIADYFFSKSDKDISPDFQALSLQSQEIYKKLSLIYASLPKSTPSFVPSTYSSNYEKMIKRVGDLQSSLAQAKNISAVLPNLLSHDKKSSYLVLLQNNMELRPTGGFIGSYAIISLDSARLIDLEVYDVYSADGQLDGYVKPPEEIEEHLGEDNWYLRDSNWEPDFPETAKRVEWFLDKTMGNEVDATIAINLFTIQEILRATGPVTLPDYQEEINADNLFERAEFHSEIDFFPGSTQKQEFLGALTDALFLKLEGQNDKDLYRVLFGLYNSLVSKNTLISHKNQDAMQVLGSNGWSGAVLSPICPQTDVTCYQDSLMINDANVGINKGNYFLRRAIALDVSIDPDRTLAHSLSLTYENTSNSYTWPGGNYKNYQRLYLPLSAKNIEVRLGDELLSASDLKIEKTSSHTIVGYVFTVPITETLNINVTYDTDPYPKEASLYHFFYQKQPGTFNDPIELTFNFPLYLKPTDHTSSVDVNGQVATFNFDNSRDSHHFIKFSN